MKSTTPWDLSDNGAREVPGLCSRTLRYRRKLLGDGERVLRIVIPEPIPSMNKGELAILEGLRASLSYCGKYQLTVFSPPFWIHDDKRNSGGNYDVVGGANLFEIGTAHLDSSKSGRATRFLKTWGSLLLFSVAYRLSAHLASLLFKDTLLQAIANADLILAGHDGLLSPSHFYLALSANIMRKPLALFGGSHSMQGRKNFIIRKYLQYLIKSVVLCTVRDPRAKDFFVANDVSPEQVHVFPDPAVLLRPAEDARVYEILRAEGVSWSQAVPLYCLIPVSDGIVFRTSFSAEVNPEKKRELRVRLWKKIVMHLLEVTDAHLVFMPHCLGPADDRRMNRDVYDAVPREKNRLTLIDGEYSPGELKGIMKHAEFVLGERAHALIGAASVATPCLALTTAEDLRMHSMMRYVFERPTFDLNDPDMDQLKALLTHEWSRRRETALTMRCKTAEIHTAAAQAAELLKRKFFQSMQKLA